MIKIGSNQFLFHKTESAEIECGTKLGFGEYTVFLGYGCRAVRASDNGRELLVLGYITDAHNGTRTEQELALSLLKGLEPDGSNIAGCFSRVGGRYVCFMKTEEKLLVWNDTCALKQLFYDINTSKGEMCAASQARYIAQLKGYSPESDAAEYLEQAKKQPEFSMPLFTTLYKNIERLLPNHFIICDGQPQRRMAAYRSEATELSEAKRVELIADLLKNGSVSVSRIFDPLVSLTGGLDSRLALVAFSESKDDLDVFTLKYINMPDDHSDLVISRQFSEKFGYKHRIIECKSPSAEFVSEYYDHSEHPHDYWIQMSASIKSGSSSGNILVKGSCDEIVQFSSGVLPDSRVTPSVICGLFDIPKTEFSLNAVSKWLSSAKGFAKAQELSLLSLFYWEHRMGSWLAECLNEADTVSDMFSPFNVREALVLMASFPADTRIPPDFSLFKLLLESCEKGSSLLPINPGRYSSAFSKQKLFIKYRAPFLYRIAVLMRGKM